MENRSDGFTAVEDRYAGYTVYDRDGDKIGKVDDLFLDENDTPEYFGVKMGFLGTRSTLIPAEITSTDESNQSITVSSDKDTVKNGPTFDDDREITPEYEREVLGYYGVDRATGDGNGSYGEYYGEHSGAGTTGSTTAGTVGSGMSMGDTESGEFREHDRADEGPAQSRGDDLADEDELRVQRSEEELVAGTRERQAGALHVRKRVRTDRERIEVPVTEEEVVTDKRAVAKEEVRIRKDVVEDTEVVEDDVRREEVDVEDATERGRGTGL